MSLSLFDMDKLPGTAKLLKKTMNFLQLTLIKLFCVEVEIKVSQEFGTSVIGPFYPAQAFGDCKMVKNEELCFQAKISKEW